MNPQQREKSSFGFGISPLRGPGAVTWPAFWCFAAVVLAVSSVEAGPNLMAIGNYYEMPVKRAEGRDSLSGREVIFSFDDPQFDFGRVIVRSSQPSSIVRRDLFVGFSGTGLTIDTTGQGTGTNLSVNDLEVWLRIKGRIEPGAKYEWEFETPSGDVVDSGIPAIIPAAWAGGEQVGAEITIRPPEAEHDDRIQRLLIPHGVVQVKQFTGPSSGAWIVLLPRLSSNRFTVSRVSFRQIDISQAAGLHSAMPGPIRYIPIRSVLADQITSILERSAAVLKSQRNSEFFWAGSSEEESVAFTARVLAALYELNPRDTELTESMKWLGNQRPAPDKPWGVPAAAFQLYCLARHGSFSEHRALIQSQVEFLTDAQGEDGGWGPLPNQSAGVTSTGRGATRVESDHEHSFLVMLAMREAAFAGAVVDRKVWRGVMQYWGQAQAHDGGFTRRVSGISLATTTLDTATGAASLLTAVHMTAALGGRRCTTYLGSGLQLRTVTDALNWLDSNYKELFRTMGSITLSTDEFVEARHLQFLGAISGITRFNDKNHFVESAETLIKLYDRESALFGQASSDGRSIVDTSSARTADALTILGVGAAPSVCQRIVVGDDEKGWAEYSADTQHLVRYLSTRQGRQFNWRRMTIEDSLRDLVKTPILFVNVVGPFQWSEQEWKKIREYCLAGGSVIFDIVNEEESLREAVTAGLARAFPEYTLADLPADHPLLSFETKSRQRPKVKAMGNGFRDFLFLPAESWSCKYHLYQVSDNEEAFQFVANLLAYALDGGEPPSAFLPSTYAAASVPSVTMNGWRLEVGGERPAYPNLLDTMNRLMQANFRTAVTQAESAEDADIVWVSVTGSRAPGENEKKKLLDAIRAGKFIFSDVVSGQPDWDESFRAFLRTLDGDITLEKLSRSDPVYTGEIPGTQGFEASVVEFRKALHDRFTTRGRCDLYRISYKGKPIGVHSAYDLSSGIGYHYFPNCRGVMPEEARKIAMNAFLMAYRWKLDGGPK
jgi:hypothetical protein